MTSLQTRFNHVSKIHHYAGLSDEQWAILMENQSERSIQRLDDLVQQVEDNQPKATDAFKLLHKAARLTDSMRAHGFQGLKVRDTYGLFDLVGSERVANAAQALRNGEASAKALLHQWLQKVESPHQPENAPTPPAASPAAATPEAPTNSRFEAVPPPPGTRTAPVQRGTAGANNVRTLSPPARHEAPRQAPSRQDARPPMDEGYHEEPTGRHFAPDASPQRPYQHGGRAEQVDREPERKYDQHSCYGKDLAVTFERTPTQDRLSKTVNFKVAKAKFQGKTCKEGIDWTNAIVLMLEPHEVQIVYAVLMGFGPKCRFAGHGRDNQKWFEFAETEGEWAGYIRVTAGHGSNDTRRVNIGHTDLKEVMEVFSRTLQDQAGEQDPVFIMAEVRRVYDLYAKRTAAQESRQGTQGGQRQQQDGGGRQYGQRRHG